MDSIFNGDFFWISLAIVAFGYFISDGLKNFKNPNAKNMIDSLAEEGDHELIPIKDVHHHIGINKADIPTLMEKHPDIPHIQLNDSIYFPKKQLEEWLKSIRVN